AGVVDAGGRGLCVLLDALAAVVTGTAQPLPSASPLSPVQPSPAGSAGPPGQHGPGYAYEVEYLLDAPAVAVDRLRVALAGLGGSLVVVGSAPRWKVHVHTDDVGAAIEAGIAAGRPSQVRVTRFADHQDAPATAGVRAVVAVAHGDGIRHLLEDGGAVVVAAVPGCGPSASELLAAVRASGAAEVVLLPNDQGGHAVARLIADQARSEGVAVAVVPTRSAVQGLAALAVADPARRFDEDVITMTSAAGATRCAELTVAEHGAITTAGLCRAGDVLGIVDGEVVLIGSELEAAALDLVERMLAAGGELVTVVLGSSAPPGLGSVLDRHLHQARPGVETVVYLGGQQEPPVLLGVE
ncbi:MAG: dihydroxyacetone kinase, partial [Actinomycetota bacterium]|nr:dihydroxyacetone kinase [Actinomycetota bacterium]